MSDEYCYCDYDGPSVCSATKPKARKEHKCTSCHNAIVPGDTYERTWGVWEGEAQVFKTCCQCVDLRDWVKAHIPCFCWTYQELLWEARETIAHASRGIPGMWMEFGRKLVVIKRKQRERRARKAASKAADIQRHAAVIDHL